MLKRFFAILLSLLFIFLSVGCDNTKEAYIYFELPEMPETLDPQTAYKDTELIIIKNIFEGLLRVDEKGKVVCGVAESYEKKGLTYTFKLRKDAKWSNGDKITANDFAFAIKRAVSPEVKAPFASRLFSIVGAQEIYNGSTNYNSLGVNVISDNKLKITLKQEDPNFENILTSSIAMPCNEKFFNSSAGKYGLFADNILSNGSYKLSRWRKDPFGIRLYSNNEYSGNFIPNNAAVFLTCDKDETALEKLEKNSIDIAFIDSALVTDAENLGLNIAEFENICWVLTINNDFSANMRKSLSMLIGSEIYSNNLPSGYSVSTSLFPSIFSANKKFSTSLLYDLEAGKKLYFQEVNKLEDKKFPSDVVLYYFDDGYIKNVVTDIVGHWQSNLSAFVNIESVSSVDLLEPQLQNQTLKMSIFPISAESTQVAEYLKKFGISYKGEPLEGIQSNILKGNNIIPIMFQTTNIAYSKALTNLSTELGNGYIDFSFIIKTE